MMIFTIESILSEPECLRYIEIIDQADFIDGKKTAGWSAQAVKNNLQLNQQEDCYFQLTEKISEKLYSNPLFSSATLPRQIHSFLFSRYEVGMSYGQHVDNALMGLERLRADISFTLFLSPKDSYQGGDLLIDTIDGERSYKLDAGSILLYPSTTLHQVTPITSGLRLAVIGWIQSLVRDPLEREILFDLDTTRRSLWAKEGKSLEFDLLSKTYSNLLRKWCN